MTKTVFIDTSIFIILIDDKEARHQGAIELFNKYISEGMRFVTTDYVLTEFLTFARCRKKEPIEKLVKFMNQINVSDIQIVGITRGIFQDALTLMAKYRDHYFSMTDCISFIVMKEIKTKNVLTTDKHFSIAGFNNLLRL